MASKAKGIKAGNAYVVIDAVDRASAALKRVSDSVKKIGASINEVGRRTFVAGSAATAGFVGLSKLFAATGDALDELSTRTGFSVETLSEIGYAADLAGLSLSDLESIVRKGQKTLVDAAKGGKAQQAAFKRLGLSVDELIALDPEQQFFRMAEALYLVEDALQRGASAMELFGRSGTSILPFIAQGAQGIEELRLKARALGLTVSAAEAKEASALADTFDTLGRVVGRLKDAIGSALAPTLRNIGDRLAKATSTATAFIKKNQGLITTALAVSAGVAVAGAALLALGGAITAVGITLRSISDIAGFVTGVFKGIGPAFKAVGKGIGLAITAIASPIGIVISLLGIGATAFVLYTKAGQGMVSKVGAFFGSLKATAMDTFGGIRDALAAGDLQLAGEVLWAGLKLIWQQGANALGKVWLTVKNFFIETAYDMWYGALTVGTDVWAAIEEGFINTVSFLSKTWTNFGSTFQRVWTKVTSWFSDRILEVMGLFDDQLDVKAAQDANNSALTQQLADIDSEQQDQLQRKEQRRDAALAESKLAREERLSGIRSDYADSLNSMNEAEDKELKEAADKLAAKRADLDKSLAKARAAKAEADAAAIAGTPGSPNPEFDFDEIGSAVDARARTFGTFSGGLVEQFGRMFGGGSAQDRTAKSAESIDRKLDRVVRHLEDFGGSTFA